VISSPEAILFFRAVDSRLISSYTIADHSFYSIKIEDTSIGQEFVE
jgi:hypothetical protein